MWCRLLLLLYVPAAMNCALKALWLTQPLHAAFMEGIQLELQALRLARGDGGLPLPVTATCSPHAPSTAVWSHAARLPRDDLAMLFGGEATLGCLPMVAALPNCVVGCSRGRRLQCGTFGPQTPTSAADSGSGCVPAHLSCALTTRCCKHSPPKRPRLSCHLHSTRWFAKGCPWTRCVNGGWGLGGGWVVGVGCSFAE